MKTKLICSIENCERQVSRRGLCAKHYKALSESGELPLRRPDGVKNLICEVEGCNKPQLAKGLCQNHYMLQRKYGRTHLIRRPNGVKNIPCEVEGCSKPGFCKGLCEEHYNRLRTYGRLERIHAPAGSVWISTGGYKTVTYNGKQILVHRLIMEEQIQRPLKPEEIVHHINGDKLDNRIENLEIMTNSEHTAEHHKRGDICGHIPSHLV